MPRQLVDASIVAAPEQRSPAGNGSAARIVKVHYGN
jgi:hypothetical protein